MLTSRRNLLDITPKNASDNNASVSMGKYRALTKTVLCMAVMAVASSTLLSDSVEAKKLKEWFDQKPKKAMMTFDMSGKSFELQSVREMRLNRQDHKIQVIRYTPGKRQYPAVFFAIEDLGYTNSVFTARAGEDLRPSTALKRIVKNIADLGEVGEEKNKYGRVDYQHYISESDGSCLYIRQYSGWDAVGDVRGGGTTLGSTLIHGTYCNGSDQTVAASDIRDFVVSYTTHTPK